MVRVVIDTDKVFTKENMERYIELEKLRKKAKENNLLNREGKPKDTKKWNEDDLDKFRQLSSIFETIDAYSVSSRRKDRKIEELEKELAKVKAENAKLKNKAEAQSTQPRRDEELYSSPESMNHSY